MNYLTVISFKCLCEIVITFSLRDLSNYDIQKVFFDL